ncbi:MAG: primase [Ignavibacteria bacterium]|nr:primase [Ignavibacteria bacterium]
MAYSDESVEMIKRVSDIVEVIGEVVDLRKRGANFTGLCPFHKEKTPSFSVSQEKGIFKCFGCGKSGNVISFMMEFHTLSFTDAIEQLAKKFGVSLDKQEGKRDSTNLNRRELAIKALTDTANYYAFSLRTESGRKALEYCYNRGINEELISKFILGYSPDSWDAALNELHRKGFSDETLLDAGVILRPESGNLHDRFRNRLMFPIKDYLGRIVGFGARKMSEQDQMGKYVNSPQSLVYDKSKILYGLFEAKNTIRNSGSAILVEGYADCISLHAAGFEHTVASSGTALTNEQLDLLYRYCKKIYFLYDGDDAGVKAAERGLELALRRGFETYIVQLPPTEDPDSFVRSQGRAALETYLRESALFIDFIAVQYKKRGMFDSPQGKSEAARNLLKMVSAIPDRMQHDFYIGKMAAILGLSESQLRKIYDEKKVIEEKQTHFKPDYSTQRVKHDEALIQEDESEQTNQNTAEEVLERLLPEEKLLLKLGINSHDALKMMKKKFNIKPETFITPDGTRLFNAVLKYSKAAFDILHEIIESHDIDEADRNALADMVLKEEQPSEHYFKYFDYSIPEKDLKRNIEDAVAKLELKKIIWKIEESQQLINKTTDAEAAAVLLNEYLELTNKKKKIEDTFIRNS